MDQSSDLGQPGSQGVLPPLSPLRTVHASFPATAQAFQRPRVRDPVVRVLSLEVNGLGCSAR